MRPIHTLRLLAISLSLAVTAATCAAQFNTSGAVDHVGVAREMVGDLAAGHFESVEHHFNNNVARMLPTDVLKATWTKMTSDLGSFVSIKWAGHEQKQDLDYVYVTCIFARRNIDLLFVFDALQKVAGFKTLPASTFGAWETPTYANPASFVEAEVKIGEAPWILPGTVAMPKGAGPFPAVVLVHGWGTFDEDETEGSNRIFKDIAWGLASHGIAVLRYVKRTKQYGAEISKSFATFTVEQESVTDARAAVSLLAGMSKIDPHHIFLLGVGLGGYLGPRIAAGDSQIAGLILMGAYARPLQDVMVTEAQFDAAQRGAKGASGLEEISRAEEDKRRIEDPALRPGGMVRLEGVEIPTAYVLDLRSYSPTQTSASLKIPILILQGKFGAVSPNPDFVQWSQALSGSRNVTFRSYPNLNQSFLPTTEATSDATGKAYHVPLQVIEEIRGWVNRSSAPAKKTLPK